MTTMNRDPWEKIREHQQFSERLRELSRNGERRLFHPLEAGDYVVSVQASGEHLSRPQASLPPSQIQAWEIAVFTTDGRLLDERRDPEIITLPPEWRRYWRNGIACGVPTSTVAVLMDRFTMGPDYYDRFILELP